MNRLGIHIFRRDLRLEDNTALNALAEQVDEILPVFIFDDRQITEHPYRSRPGLQMLIESLQDLDAALHKRGSKLHIYRGIAEDVVATLIRVHSPTAVSFNADYTPFAVKRDMAIRDVSLRESVAVVVHDDATLYAPGSVLNKDGKPYKVYTHYRLAIEALPIPAVTALSSSVRFVEQDADVELDEMAAILVPASQQLRVRGGRAEAQKQLQALSDLSGYKEKRDFPAIKGTSLLSAHIKFGTLSIREIYAYARTHMPDPTTFLREILWHDFFTTVAALTPHVYQGAFRPEFDALKWSTNEEHFERWKQGMTGFPIVDAGMRELKETGYMHNRVRMIVASFLIKDLHISWQWGERYFAQMLTDYDPAVNNGNWQWVAGTGCDASPWFRIFNPWLQQQKFDADCVYIKQWVPELRDLATSLIHDETGVARVALGYPAPMCDHKTEAQRTKERYGIVS